MLTKQEQARSLEAMQRAVAAQKQRDPWQGPRDHHRRGLERAEEFIEDFQKACPSSTALDFELGVRLQQLLCFQSFEDVFKLGQRLGDRALAFVTALEKVSLGGEARQYHDARFRYYVLYLAASRSQALAFLDEIFAPLTNEEERRWIEMLRIAGVLATKRTVAFVKDAKKAQRFEVRFKVGAAEAMAVISGQNVEVIEQWAAGENPAGVYVPDLEDSRIPEETRVCDRKALRQRLRDSLVKKLAKIDLEVEVEPIQEGDRVIGYAVTLPADVEVVRS